ncbi:MAG TPA: lipid II flippase MurJ [Ktedonobacteraceae bacterium]|nr:lipid II flippase MurJ [Ktedonobacteraceae bacterium]
MDTKPEAVPTEKTDVIAETAPETMPAATPGIPEEQTIVSLTDLTPEQAPPSERKQMVKSASLVMVGNLGSSILGMVRQITITALGTNLAGPFASALVPQQTFLDLLANGTVSGALIPTFTDYATPEKREELRRIVFSIVNFMILLMAAVALIFLIIAPWFVSTIVLSSKGYTPAEQNLTITYAQIIIFSLIILGPFAILQAALYSQKEFGWPAFATAAFHVGIIAGAIVGAIIGEQHFGNLGIAFGVLLGAAGEIGLLLPGLRRLGLRYKFVMDLKHPAIKRILRLYGPVALSFLVATIFIYLDKHLASGTPGDGAANVTALSAATTLIQFPGGLVAAALSFAVLPTISRYATEGDTERFKDMILLGLRLGFLLMIPAAAGLISLKGPIVALIFEHGKYHASNADLTAIALQNYAYQLPFLAMDQLLIFSFYARKNTIIPVAMGVFSYSAYLLVALPFWRTIGMPALAFANSAQNTTHAIAMLIALRLAIGSLHLRKTIPTILKILVAAAIMVAVALGSQLLLSHVSLFAQPNLLGHLLMVLVAGGLTAGAYIGCVILFKIEEINLLKGAILAKLGRG